MSAPALTKSPTFVGQQEDNRVAACDLSELLLRQEERRMRQGMRLHQDIWRKEHKLKRNVPTGSAAILLASGIFLGWAGSRFLDR
ncbi:MAG TPA: hypothetical protein VE734_00195 [Terriglobales bacterium]|jgi:hypothetical protein|nr:hypothetical protein [Terriglobales bacterium]